MKNQAAPGKIEPKPQEKDFAWKEPEPAPQEMQSLDAEKLWLGGHDATFNEILELENVLALGGEEQEVDAFINAQQNIENRKQQLRREGYTNRQIEQELEKKRREANKAFTATVQKAVQHDINESGWLGATVLSKPLQLAGGVMGSIDVMGQMAKKVLTGSDAEIDLNTKAQLWGNVARNIQDTSRDVLAQGALGEKRSWLYDAGVMAADELLDNMTKIPLETFLETNSSFLRYFKNAKTRGRSDAGALKEALTGAGFEVAANIMNKDVLTPYFREIKTQLGMPGKTYR